MAGSFPRFCGIVAPDFSEIRTPSSPVGPMNQTPHSDISQPRTPNRLPPPRARLPEAIVPVRHAAKWPPDDDGLPPGPPGVPSYSGGGGDDGNFKKGRFGVAAVIVGILIAGAAAAVFLIGGAKLAPQVTPQRIPTGKKHIPHPP